MRTLRIVSLVFIGLGLWAFFGSVATMSKAPDRFAAPAQVRNANGSFTYVPGKEREEWRHWRLCVTGVVVLAGGLVFTGALMGLYCQHHLQAQSFRRAR